MASQRVKKSKISWGRMPPDPPRVERALLAPRKSFALSQHSPVTLTYSPATVILNENPAIPPETDHCFLFFSCYFLDYGRNFQPPPEDWSKLLPRNDRVERYRLYVIERCACMLLLKYD